MKAPGVLAPPEVVTGANVGVHRVLSAAEGFGAMSQRPGFKCQLDVILFLIFGVKFLINQKLKLIISSQSQDMSQ